MRRLIVISMSLLLMAALLNRITLAQEAQPESARKVVNKIAPLYPEMAGRMHLEGVVKLQVVVAPNGSVKSVEIHGGHPVLVDAAENAVYKWRWAPAKEESKETVEFKFSGR